MIQIKAIKLGLPPKKATQLLIRTLPFDLYPTTIGLYYEVLTEENEVLANGNLELNEDQVSEWGTDDTVVEKIVLEHLGLTRK